MARPRTPTSSHASVLGQVFGSDSTQEKLYKQAIVPIVCEVGIQFVDTLVLFVYGLMASLSRDHLWLSSQVMDGFNCTIFAYGQTGTGKTWTVSLQMHEWVQPILTRCLFWRRWRVAPATAVMARKCRPRQELFPALSSRSLTQSR